MEYKVCTRCVMDSSDKSISFDSAGRCNYCTDVLARATNEYFPNEIGRQKLETLINQVKESGRGREFDCMVGVSGGIDSSYIMYLGYKYDLRMLCVHIDDGLDTEEAKNNIKRLCGACNAKLVSVIPDMEQYKGLIRALFVAGVSCVANAQDNLLLKALWKTAQEYQVVYSLSGANFSMESILQRGEDPINACDSKFLKTINRKFGCTSDDKLGYSTMFERYIWNRYFNKTKTVYPLNYIDYRLSEVLKELNDFCGYTYYGGKHHESVLTRFLQCYYLPTYFDIDKRRSHFSSMIMSGQMTRDEAMAELQKRSYASEELLNSDIRYLAEYLNITVEEFNEIIAADKHSVSEYSISCLNRLAPIARKFRRWIG